MALTPERIAELERLKALMNPLAKEAARQGQLSQNNQRYIPPTGKAKGGTMSQDAMQLAVMNKSKHMAYGGSARNWAPGQEEKLKKALSSLKKKVRTEGVNNHTAQDAAHDSAINQWIDSVAHNYIKKSMATEKDPVRQQAENDVFHMSMPEEPGYWNRKGETRRKISGGEQMAKSDKAKTWENRTDAMLEAEEAQAHQDMMHLAPGMYSDKDEWVKKLDPKAKLWNLTEHFDPADLGMDHIRDVLHEDLVSGRIRPEQLSKISMAQAVKRAHEYDQEMEKRRQETAIQTTNEMPMVHEYPETGMKWIELAKPDGDKFEESIRHLESDPKEWQKAVEDFRQNNSKKLEDALKYEGDTMGHCVGGKGYCEKVKRGEARIFSLRDAKGEPHVTIETEPSKKYDEDEIMAAFPSGVLDAMKSKGPAGVDEYVASKMKEINSAPDRIVQIKGKGNAKPHKKYIPHVQHFVKSGDWSHIGDYENTDLIQVKKGKHATKEEVEALGRHHYPEHNMPAENVLMHYDRMRGMPEMQNEVTKNFIADMEAGNYRMPAPVIKKAQGGNVQLTVEQMRQQLMAAGKQLPDISQIGAQEAPNMPVKSFVIPENGAQGQMPMGGVDMSPMQPGQQMLPANALQPNPLMPQQPQPPAGPAPQGGSNILQMTPQGQKMAALSGSPQGNLPAPKMAVGGPVPVQNHPFMSAGDRPMPFIAKEGGSDNAPMNNDYSDNGATDFSIDNIQQLAGGGNVQGYASKGYVHHTDINPHPKAGKRFVAEQLPGLMPETPVDMGELYNQRASLQLRPWDSTSRNVKVTNVSGHDLTAPLITEGGQGFARDIALNKEGISGASGENIQKRIQSRANTAHEENIKQGGRGHTYDIIANMDKFAPLFTNMPLHVQLDLLKQANLNPKELAHIESRIRARKVQKKTPFTNLLPLSHPDSMKQLIGSGAIRKAVSEELASKTNQKLLDYNLEDLLAAVTVPEIHAAPAGYAGNTFIANVPHAGLGPQRHTVYDKTGYGEYAGKGEQIPAELYMPDVFERVSRELQKQYPKAGASAIRSMTIGALQTRAGNVSQMVNDRVMRNLERYKEGVKRGNIQNPNDLYGVLGHFYKEHGGYKAGGGVKKANVTDNLDTMRLALTRNKKAK